MIDKRLICGTIAAAVVMFVFEWFFHGTYMMPMYEETQSAWRSFEEMQQFSPVWCVSMKLAMGAALAWLFSRNYEAKGMSEGFRFGLYVGVVIGLVQLYSYFYLPVPLGIPLSWLAGWILEGILVGLALAYTYAWCAKKAIR